MSNNFINNFIEYKVKVYANGNKYWYKEGRYHREDGPAIEFPNGGKYWYKEGKLHREDGPAIEYFNGDKEWYKEGQYHREDGPAVEYSNGNKCWYINGKELTEEEFNKRKESCSNKEVIIDGKIYRLVPV